jgi:hypothetical protein
MPLDTARIWPIVTAWLAHGRPQASTWRSGTLSATPRLPRSGGPLSTARGFSTVLRALPPVRVRGVVRPSPRVDHVHAAAGHLFAAGNWSLPTWRFQPGAVSLNPRSRTTDERDPRDPQGPAGIRTKAPVSPGPALHLGLDPVKILNENKLRAAIPLVNALPNPQPCVPAIGHLRMPRRANSRQFVASVASR